jgi:hypothetical protein
MARMHITPVFTICQHEYLRKTDSCDSKSNLQLPLMHSVLLRLSLISTHSHRVQRVVERSTVSYVNEHSYTIKYSFDTLIVSIISHKHCPNTHMYASWAFCSTYISRAPLRIQTIVVIMLHTT